jgi:hypothetical protein
VLVAERHRAAPVKPIHFPSRLQATGLLPHA